ncbi:hypothetical protein I350_05271 [Cryptococcus amylolentus CBS 6273]|uniref:Protein kinase domain-containing protein n=1 Tax=Cryptococcus amylolentus CBS 6273 TaxID=1296118 RepID=A0A1E3JXQ1_9TREE|nr:hypothetical protein I350_05271 [Cryptococcus amylolentus CBS 6273]
MNANHQTPRSVLDQVGDWKLGATLGRGAYAHVRLATHKNGHKAACKILPALHRNGRRPATTDETIDAIEAHKEVVLLKALSGAGVDGVAGLEGVIEEEGWTFVFLTLYPCSVSSMPTPWTQSSLAIFFRRLLITTHNLHRLNVSHEDIKRSNVLATSEGLPILVDFGFSHFKAFGGLVKSAGGTLDYSSPEKTADIKYDPKANDVWSLGILLIKMAGLPHPYAYTSSDDTSSAVKKRILLGDPKFRWRLRDQGPGGMAELAEGMLESDPLKRWTIPRILNHPYLRTEHPDPPPFKLPSTESTTLRRPSQSVVEDLCFLAYLNGEFALCETSLRIEQRLKGEEACWEKRWASMLGAWSKRVEMDWQDIPASITPIKPRHRTAGPVISAPKPAQKTETKPLKEIHLFPNIPLSSFNPPSLHLPDKKLIKPLRSRLYDMKSKEGNQATSNTGQRPIASQKAAGSKLEYASQGEDQMFPHQVSRQKNVLRVKKPKRKMGDSKALYHQTNFQVYTSDPESETEAKESPDATPLDTTKNIGTMRFKAKVTQDLVKKGETETGRLRRKEGLEVGVPDNAKSPSSLNEQMQGFFLAPSDDNVTRRRSPRFRTGDVSGR